MEEYYYASLRLSSYLFLLVCYVNLLIRVERQKKCVKFKRSGTAKDAKLKMLASRENLYFKNHFFNLNISICLKLTKNLVFSFN